MYGLDGYFPKPRDGQSLAEFLGSHEFKRNVAELDRENAHFRISESLIAAFEMVGSEVSDPALLTDVTILGKVMVDKLIRHACLGVWCLSVLFVEPMGSGNVSYLDGRSFGKIRWMCVLASGFIHDEV